MVKFVETQTNGWDYSKGCKDRTVTGNQKENTIWIMVFIGPVRYERLTRSFFKKDAIRSEGKKRLIVCLNRKRFYQHEFWSNYVLVGAKRMILLYQVYFTIQILKASAFLSYFGCTGNKSHNTEGMMMRSTELSIATTLILIDHCVEFGWLQPITKLN